MDKKAFLFCIILAGLGFACSEDLNTVPTTDVSDELILKDAEGAEVAMNGIYKILYTPNSTVVGTTGNVQQCHGFPTANLIADLMAEDFVQHESGNGWFFFTYDYSWRTSMTSSAHGYFLWNMFYHVIYNANAIIARAPQMEGEQADIDRIKGQALALRAYSYYYLTLFFQHTYVGNEQKPGVPLYLEPKTESIGRGTMQGVYDQILADLDEASKLIPTSYKQPTKIHIDYYLVKAFQAKVFLTMERWAEASAAAQEALKREASISKMLTTKDDLTKGFNDVKMSGVMWGAEIIADDAAAYGTWFCHLDEAAYYGKSSRKCLDNALFWRLPSNDYRQGWWGPSAQDTASHVQVKYKWRDLATSMGDLIFMRGEDMLLTAAEAECHQGNFAKARELVQELMYIRMPKETADAILAARTDASTYNSDTHAASVTLMDEILFQRRIELWGETGRLFDIKRLKLGFTRVYLGTNHPSVAQLGAHNTGPGSNEFMFLIPRYEFDGNTEMDLAKDQNPY
ncbi:MAG: RagB/SusD family nutrient uptake outer membrane protein [Bacteroidales bacterium]|nr:RagB/SusD family nutrient uptake outer membrane protein [Bacteroidales bacterium]